MRRLKKLQGQKVFFSRQNLKQHCKSSTTPKQLLVDISIISKNDAGTGIQRVVRGMLAELSSTPPAGYTINTIAGTRTKPYRYTNGEEIIVNPGDIFFGLDLAASAVFHNYQQLVKWKKQGTTFHFILHDLLPLHYPKWFTKKGVKTFRRWIKCMVILADNVFCFSQFAVKDLTETCKKFYNITDLPTHIIPMAWDFSNVLHSTGLPSNFDSILTQLKQHQTILMVGTLEPRKGHGQMLEAFEHLWRAGKDCNFIIIGRPGWKTKKLQKKLRNHPELGNYLFWFEDASDETLLKLYAICDGVIIASFAEGFGLPLIEALWHGKPVFARDLPVFRERHQQGIKYFSATDCEELYFQLSKWLEQIKVGISVDQPTGAPSWKGTIEAIIAHLTPAK